MSGDAFASSYDRWLERPYQDAYADEQLHDAAAEAGMTDAEYAHEYAMARAEEQMERQAEWAEDAADHWERTP